MGINNQKRSMFNFSSGLFVFLKDKDLKENSILIFKYVRYGDEDDVVKVVKVDKRNKKNRCLGEQSREAYFHFN